MVAAAESAEDDIADLGHPVHGLPAEDRQLQAADPAVQPDAVTQLHLQLFFQPGCAVFADRAGAAEQHPVGLILDFHDCKRVVAQGYLLRRNFFTASAVAGGTTTVPRSGIKPNQ